MDETQTGKIEDVCVLGPFCMTLFIVVVELFSLVFVLSFKLSLFGDVEVLQISQHADMLDVFSDIFHMCFCFHIFLSDDLSSNIQSKVFLFAQS